MSNSSSAQEISLGKELLLPSWDEEELLLLLLGLAATSNSGLTSVMAEESVEITDSIDDFRLLTESSSLLLLLLFFSEEQLLSWRRSCSTTSMKAAKAEVRPDDSESPLQSKHSEFKMVLVDVAFNWESWPKGKLEEAREREGDAAETRQNEFPIHPSRHHHSFFFRIVATVSRSFCLSKVEKATFVMVVEPEEERKRKAGAVVQASMRHHLKHWNLSA